jgi:acyl-coenzyme A synthetase/AMP-(fatty) acid ligase
MTTVPLLTAPSPHATVAWRAGRPVSAARFLADVRACSARLPPGQHVLNVCNERYHFAVGFAAALTSGRSSLLPASTAPHAIQALRDSTQDLICVTDDSDCLLELPQVYVRIDCADDDEADTVPFRVPTIAAEQVAAWVYTSGSTGAPVGHRKTWGSLVRCLRAGAERLGLEQQSHSLVATVPPQHMYGFELSILLPLVAGHAACSERPLHAAEVAATLASVPRPRVLITTPVHLRALLASTVSFPEIDLIVSATAPLSQQLAGDCEQRFRAPLREIYGSTETGEMAMRRTAQELLWELWPGITLEVTGDTFIARGGHIETPTPLQDLVLPVSEQYFLLQGRRTDLVNIAGKRSSISYLNHHLQAIPGVVDGSFVMRSETAEDAGVTRLAAMVVAPTLTPTQLNEELRLRIDSAFMPRPLLFVDRLPRNASGKLPLAAIETLLAQKTRSGGHTQ